MRLIAEIDRSLDRSLWSLGVEVGALWRGTLHPAAETLLRELKEQARSLEPARAA